MSMVNNTENKITLAEVIMNKINKDNEMREKAILDLFNVTIPDGYVLILHTMYREVIGDSHDKIRFSEHIDRDTVYKMQKPEPMDYWVNKPVACRF